MVTLSTPLITLACLCAGILLGSVLRSRLPDHHLRDDSKEAVKTAIGMIATLVALVIGLLVSSAKSSYDQASAGITQVGAKTILLDRALRRYGPEANEIRDRLRHVIASSIERLWPTDRGSKPDLAAIEKGTAMEDVQEMIRRLAPHDETHRASQTQALEIINELSQSRWLMIEQAQATLPTVFLVMLVFWLTVLFTGLGLLAPRNLTTASCLFLCALSMTGAILLIMEMNRPFEGAIQASPAALYKAVSVISR
jgi:hypothetical protein